MVAASITRVRQAAAARNLVSSDALSEMADADVVNLIFAPGFSTASEVTGLSGRGVGMDSVKAAVERIGGHVSVESRPGRGTVVRLNLPFTVMMTRVMTVETAGQVFGFPLDTVVETALVARKHLVAVGAGRAFVLRDRTVPLIDLAESPPARSTRRRCPVVAPRCRTTAASRSRNSRTHGRHAQAHGRLLSGMRGVTEPICWGWQGIDC